ncbi:MAG: tRNA pseudouridine55 synthase [Parcubacteria bacterium C7867-003]|nr:MAG: tRNA pseudouridine55 synthase [Parcubacteria bacterium C7867-003]
MSSVQEKKDIHLVYKNLGETPLNSIQRFKKDNPVYEGLPITYAGRLDPMAEGLLILLAGDSVNNKDKYLDLPKIYVVEMLWGFETDTLDLLGLATLKKEFSVPKEEVRKYLEKSTGKFEQKYPAYSSKPVQGKPMFQWAREGRIGEIDIPEHEVSLFETKYLSRRTLLGKDLLTEIYTKVGLVSGDFRQKEILEKWKEVLIEGGGRDFVVDKFELRVSSGFYVRQFVKDFAETFGGVATTFHIQRTQIGDYKI